MACSTAARLSSTNEPVPSPTLALVRAFHLSVVQKTSTWSTSLNQRRSV
jgi:hypothetical protein